MQSSQIPTKFNIPFGNNAAAPDIRPIPQASQVGVQAGAASLTDGFPPACFTPVGAGGTPPFGSDFNGLFLQITSWDQWYSAGGPVLWDSAFSAAITGYPKGAVVQSVTTPRVFWYSTVENNTSNPDTGGAGWTNLNAVGGVLTGTLPNPGMASGAAAANVGILGGSLTGNLPNPAIANTAVTPGTYAAATITVQADGRLTAAASSVIPTSPPQGRLTLQTNVPVMTSSVAGATIVRYTPYHGLFVPIFNGSIFVPTSIGTELSQATTDSTKSPSATGANQVYDMFVWNDSGTIRCTRGPSWTTGGSNTVRGTGAGSTQLQLLNGILVNQFAITNGPAASQGTYVGTIASNAGSTIDYIFGSLGTGGAQTASHFVWNIYNRVSVITNVVESTASWTSSLTAFRASNGSTANRINFVLGLAEDSVDFSFNQLLQSGSSGNPVVDIGFELDQPGTATVPDFTGRVTLTSPSYDSSAIAVGSYNGLLGLHYVQAAEAGDPLPKTFYGTTPLYTFLGKFRM